MGAELSKAKERYTAIKVVIFLNLSKNITCVCLCVCVCVCVCMCVFDCVCVCVCVCVCQIYSPMSGFARGCSSVFAKSCSTYLSPDNRNKALLIQHEHHPGGF
jgi:hypothetical protein